MRRHLIRTTLPFVGFALLAAAACERDTGRDVPEYEPPTTTSFTYDTAVARVTTSAETLHVRVEVAEREDQRAYGLMDRTSLDEDAGMIFLYDDVQSGSSAFYMYRTRIPLDIAFFDSSGRIVAILQMEPCPHADATRCPVYSPERPYVGALEMNRGWFGRNGVQVGDHITVER